MTFLLFYHQCIVYAVVVVYIIIVKIHITNLSLKVILQEARFFSSKENFIDYVVSCITPDLRTCMRQEPKSVENWKYVPVTLGPCLVHSEIQKVFKISYHIESYGTCMKH